MGSLFDCPVEKNASKSSGNPTIAPPIDSQTSNNNMMSMMGSSIIQQRQMRIGVSGSLNSPYSNNNFLSSSPVSNDNNNYYNNINNNHLPNTGNYTITQDPKNKSQAELKLSKTNGANNLKEQQNQSRIKENFIQQQNNGIEQIKKLNETKNNLEVKIIDLQKQLKNKEDLIIQRNKEIEEFKKKNIAYENEKKKLHK